jgi:ATP-binding cassette subfamily B protein
MIRPIPESIQRALLQHGVRAEEILLTATTDINSLGQYDVQWLLFSAEKLFIFDSEIGESPLFIFELQEIQAFRTMAAVGSGLLQIRVDDVWLDLLRFSNRLKFHFDQIAKHLERLKSESWQNVGPPQINEVDPQKCPNCGLMLEFPGEICPRCIDHGAAINRVLGLLQPYWKATVILSALLIAGIILDMAWPLLTRYLVDHVLTRSTASVEPYFKFLRGRDPEQLLTIIVLSLAGVHIIRAFINFFSGRITSIVGNAMTFDIRSKMVRKLEEFSLAYYSRQETGSLVGRTVYDTEAIQGFLSQITSGFFMQFLLVIVSFVMMVGLNSALAFWAIVPAPFVIAGAFLYWRKVHPHFQRFWDRSSKQSGLLNGILTGIRVVKAFGQEDREFNRFQKASTDVRSTRESLDRTSAWFQPLMGIVFQVGGWIIWYVGGQSVLDQQLSLGTLMAFFGYLSMFYGPLGSLTNLTTWLTQFSTQMHRIYEVLDTPAVLPFSDHPVTPPPARGEIEFKNVNFSYSRGSPVLQNLSLHIKPGERIGIVGRSGSGKTSLVNLVCRFYDVDSGNLLLDGVDIRNLGKDDLRSRISIVLQEPFLFRGSLIENIHYGSPQSSLEDAIEVARAANAHDFIMRHSLAYDSSVGERGQELSGGERQRISIARALLWKAPILILDEATSSIDSESELAIQHSLREIRGSRTVIIIAHRLSTLRECDRIYVIENGGVLESGNHHELMQKNGRYKDWVTIQQAGNQSTVEQPQNSSVKTNWLKPEGFLIERGHRGDLQITKNQEKIRGCFALRCFPAHYPNQYISLRYIDVRGHSREVGIIKDLATWPQNIQKIIHESLDRRYFFHRIERIHSIRKLSQFLEFKAQTHLGDLDFTLRSEPDSAQAYGKKGKLLVDVEDNIYLIDDFKQLPRSDQETFERFIYW